MSSSSSSSSFQSKDKGSNMLTQKNNKNANTNHINTQHPPSSTSIPATKNNNKRKMDDADTEPPHEDVNYLSKSYPSKNSSSPPSISDSAETKNKKHQNNDNNNIKNKKKKKLNPIVSSPSSSYSTSTSLPIPISSSPPTTSSASLSPSLVDPYAHLPSFLRPDWLKPKVPSLPSSSFSSSTSPTPSPLSLLSSSRFRLLNEQLYVSSSSSSFDYFSSHPEEFSSYHTGFREQSSKWPESPVHVISSYIQSRYKLVHNTKMIQIGDFGCGDAELADLLHQWGVPLDHLHNYDLISTKSTITSCNLSSVPIANNMLNIAVFSLSLMGNDYFTFITEGFRALKIGGEMIIAEVKSRFKMDEKEKEGDGVNHVGIKLNKVKVKEKKKKKVKGDYDGEEGFNEENRRDYQRAVGYFIRSLNSIGLKLINRNENNKMFVLLHFIKERIKEGEKRRITPPMALAPCIYKRR